MNFTVNKKTLKAIITEVLKGKASNLSACSAWTIKENNGQAEFFRFFIKETVTAKIDILGPYTSDGTEFVADHVKIVNVLKIGKAETVTFDTIEKTLDGIDIASDITKDKIPELANDTKDIFVFSAKNEEFSFIDRNAVPHISDDETRYFMTGVYFEAVQWDGMPENISQVNIAATNGRTCYVRDSLFTSAGIGKAIVPPFAFIRPKKTLSVSVRIVARQNSNDTLCIVKSTGSDFTVEKMSSCIDGQFPNCRRVIPENTVPNFHANTEKMRMAIESARVLCAKKTMRIILTINKDTASVTASGEGATVKEFSFPCIFSGTENYKIALNADYLLYCLPVTANTDICFSDYNMKALTVQNCGLAVIMPMQME